MASPAVKKKSSQPKVMPAGKQKKLADEVMTNFKREAKERYDKAHKLYAKQDEDTQDALDRMTVLLCRIARKNMWISTGSSDRLVLQIPEETVYHNMFYMANEILKDLAQFDIKVAGFHFPDDLCAVCFSEKIAKPRKKVKR